MNSELLKSALIDAKAVKATAVANAKEALLEAFNGKFEAMFAEKLREDAELDETEGKAVSTSVPARTVAPGAPKLGHDANKYPVGAGDPKGQSQTFPVADNKIDEESTEAGMSSEDLDEIIKELENEISQDETQKDENPMASTPSPVSPDAPAPTTAPPSEPEINAPVTGPDINNPQVPEPTAPQHQEPDGDEAPVPPAPVAQPPVAATNPDEEEVNLEELLKSLNEEFEEKECDKEEKEKCEDEEKEDKLDEVVKDKGVPTNVEGQDADLKAVTSKDPTTKKLSKDNCGGIENTKQLKEQVSNLKSELNDYHKTVEFLRKQINEVNLLNAKLLFTNKLFREFSMDNTQKMKIVEAFDLTKNVREVKMIYATMADTLNNFGGKSRKVSPKPSSQISQITEGMASKPMASTKPTPSVINESVSLMAQRFQKLAGIKPTKEVKK